METTLLIRPREPEDGPRLHCIELACFQADPWPAEDFLKYDCLVAVAQDTVIGFVLSHQIYSPANKELIEREILNIAVMPEHRRHGVARLLLVAELERGGTHFLEVRESNTAARQLYERQGFEVVGRRKQYYESPRETAILMRHSENRCSPSCKPEG